MSGSPFPHHDRPMGAGLSHVGQVRTRNEDRHWIPGEDASVESLDHFGRLFAVADGMGGHSGGDVASQTVIDTLFNTFYASNDDVFPRLQRALDAANEAVVTRAAADPNLADMGATLTAVALYGQAPCMATLAHVGDSRAYLIRDGTISQISEEHTFIAEAIRTGTLTEAEAAVHPNRHAITRAMGRAGGIQAYYYNHELRPGDRLVLCSDGLTNVVTDYEILQYALAYTPDDAVQHLVALANERGGPDNVTVVVVAMPGAVISVPAPVPVEAGPTAPTVVLRPLPGGPGGSGAGPAGGPLGGPPVGPVWHDGPGRTAPSLAPSAAGWQGLWVRLGGIAAVSLAVVALVLATSLGVDRELGQAEQDASSARAEAAAANATLLAAASAGDMAAQTAAQATKDIADARVTVMFATLEAMRATATFEARPTLRPTQRSGVTAVATRAPQSAASVVSLVSPLDGQEIKSCAVRLVWRLEEAPNTAGQAPVQVGICRKLRDGAPECETVSANPDRSTTDYRPGRDGTYEWRVIVDSGAANSEERTFVWKDGGCAEPGATDDSDDDPNVGNGGISEGGGAVRPVEATSGPVLPPQPNPTQPPPVPPIQPAPGGNQSPPVQPPIVPQQTPRP